MPVALVVGAAALGGGALVSSANKKAAKTAAGAATDAANQNAQLAREQRDMMRGYVDPLVPYAGAGAAALAARTGISTSNPAGNMFAVPGRSAAPPAASTPGRVANIFAQASPAPANDAAPGQPGYDPTGGVRPTPSGATGAPIASAAKPAGGMTANYGNPGGDYAGVTPTGFASDTFSTDSFGGGASGAPSGNSPAPAAAAPQGGGADWNAWLQANPDVVQYYNETPDAKGSYPNIQDFAASIYDQQKDIRSAPTSLPPSASDPGGDGGLADYMGAAPGYASRPTSARPDQPKWQDPGAAPSASSYFDPSKFTTSPGYEFRLNEGNRNLNAKFGARGLLKSGSAIQGSIDYNQGAASAEYGNWFNQQNQLYTEALGQYNADKQNNFNIFSANRDNTNRNYDLDATRADTRYDSDRGYSQNLYDTNRNYATNRYDQQVGNIFGLAGIGTGAINTLGGVGSNYVNTVAGSNTAAADAKANAAIAGANSTANLFGSVAQAVGTAYGNAGKTSFSNPFTFKKEYTF